MVLSLIQNYISLGKSYFGNRTYSSMSRPKTGEEELGHYLAGLIEGDGSITVPENLRSSKGVLLFPMINIEFALNDLPLAERLAEILGGGRIYKLRAIVINCRSMIWQPSKRL